MSGYNRAAIRFIGGTKARATSSELDTAKAFGSNSPKNNVMTVRNAVTNPRLAVGKIFKKVATNRAVEYIEQAVVVRRIVVRSRVISFVRVEKGDDGPSSAANS